MGEVLNREPVWEAEGRKEDGLVTCAFSGAPAPSSQASRAGDPCHLLHLLHLLTLAPGLLQGWKPFVWSPRKQCSFKRQSAVRGEAHTPECETVPFIKKTLWKNVRTKQCVYSDIIGVHSGIRQASCLVTSDTVYRSATNPQTTP